MATPSPFLVQGLHAGYGERTVLRDLSFQCAAGCTLVLLGPGGAGKSTLLSVLGGRRRLRPGLWHRGGLELPAEEARWMGQSFPATEVTLAQALREASGSGDAAGVLEEGWRSAPEAAQVLGEALDRPLGSLSNDLRRLAELTLAAAGAPSCVLLDEPEAELPSEAQAWVLARIAALQGSATIILATHNLKVARSLADSALLLIGGEMVETGPAEAFFDRPVHPRTRYFVTMGC